MAGIRKNWNGYAVGEGVSGFRSLETSSLRELRRPWDDLHQKLSPFSDPIYAVWGYKT
ncbi:MAG: hypothetical protein ACJ0DG_01270 [bacterium]